MKFTIQLPVDAPRAKVLELFDDPDKLSKWQPDLVSFEPMSGTPGHPGAKSRLLYRTGGRDLEMIETIEVRNLPEEFTAIYEMDGTWNRVANRFRESGPHSTQYTADYEFQFKGFLKYFAFFIRGMCERQCRKVMEQFKAFAEQSANQSK